MTMQTSRTLSASATPQGSNRSPLRDDEALLREQLSALLDGECSPQQAQAVVRAFGESPEFRQAWTSYHCVGHALRADVEAPARPDFVSGVMARIALESARPQGASEIRVVASPQAANDAVFRWKMVAGVASLVAVAAVAWQIVSTPMGDAGPQLAQAPAAGQAPLQAVVTPQGVMLRDPQLEEFLAAHRQFGGMSALQMPAGFLRNATYESSQR